MNSGRNNQCACGSGRAYRHCCEGKAAPRVLTPPSDVVMPLVALYNARRYAELENRASLLVGQHPNFGFGWKLLGAAQQMLGKNAVAAFGKAAELMPAEADVLFNLGITLRSVGQLQDAAESYRRALKIKPDYIEALDNLGNVLKDLGQLDEAVACYRRALAIKPDSATTHNNLGTALKALGQPDAAMASYQRAVALQPNYADAFYNLGNVLVDQGQLDDAAENFRRAVAIRPDLADAQMNLGSVLKELGQIENAAACYQRAVEIRPDYAEAHFNLGNALRDLDRLDQAAACYRCAVALKPDYAEALFSLGKVLQVLLQFQDAESIFRRYLTLKSDSLEANCNLGHLLKEFGKFEDAAACYRRAQELEPDSASVYVNLGSIMTDLLQYDEALANYRKALEIDPACIAAMLGLGHLHSISGEIDEAEQAYRQVLEIDSGNLNARLLLAGIRKARPDDENLTALLAIEDKARNSPLPLPYKAALCLNFALGKSLDDLGEHDRAFSNFLEGCKLKRATFKYSAAQISKCFQDTMRVLDQPTIERLCGCGNDSGVPIFVLGMPRSGTTLTEQILASHPEVHGAGELPDLSLITQREVAGERFPDNILALDPADLSRWADEYVDRLCQHAPGARHITDKMPENFWFVGLIHLLLPNAKIIHVNRNPVDTCFSCFTMLFNSNLEYTYDLAELGRYYSDYAQLMDHWRRVLPAGAFLDVQYEEIVANQEVQARRIIDFCDLEWDDACIDFHKHQRSVSTASLAQVRQPIYRTSIERWRRYKNHLGPLLDELGDLVPNRIDQM